MRELIQAGSDGGAGQLVDLAMQAVRNEDGRRGGG